MWDYPHVFGGSKWFCRTSFLHVSDFLILAMSEKAGEAAKGQPFSIWLQTIRPPSEGSQNSKKISNSSSQLEVRKNFPQTFPNCQISGFHWVPSLGSFNEGQTHCRPPQDTGVKLKRPESSGDAVVLQPHFMAGSPVKLCFSKHSFGSLNYCTRRLLL